MTSIFGRFLAKRLLHCFHTGHTHLSGGVDVPFGRYDLRPNWFAGLFSYCHTHPSGDVDVPYEGCDLLTYFLTFDFKANFLL